MIFLDIKGKSAWVKGKTAWLKDLLLKRDDPYVKGQDPSDKIEDLFEPETPVVKTTKLPARPKIEAPAAEVATHDPKEVIGKWPSFIGKIKHVAGVEIVKRRTGLTPRQRIKRYDAIHVSDNQFTGTAKKPK